jgi:hypothetical protein
MQELGWHHIPMLTTVGRRGKWVCVLGWDRRFVYGAPT